MKLIAILCLSPILGIFIRPVTAAETYEPNWESLDSRPIPAWFEDAKFGIFIHWGPYSVPAWSPKGTYSEWYQYWMQTKSISGNGKFKGPEVYDYHVKTYGEQFSYFDFGEMFTADLYEPDDWAKLFEDAGAKYIVLTSKHHDGFCLWPNEQANDRGFPWNSMEVGAKRDLLGDLTKSIRKTDLKMGIYYSMYEWFHPWWQDKDQRGRYVDEHFLPQVKDLVNRYTPDILWADGGWDIPAKEWKSLEFLAWLYNESPAKDSVLVNDRWGKGDRRKHGGYFTTEYDATVSYSRPWEECRGMGFSFGYNRNEDVEDYNDPRVLILMLADVVSHGGNLLLDIGPDGRGRIPVIMQERLLQMGKWLDVNGEAIYGTRAWKQAEQWSEGKQDYSSDEHYVGGNLILKLTVDPEPGYAVKEIMFTQKGATLYAITPKWPGEELVIKNLQVAKDSKVTLLATGQTLQWKQEAGNLVVALPTYDPEDFAAEQTYAYAFRITQVMP
jgi:alpha-L-fucosidase